MWDVLVGVYIGFAWITVPLTIWGLYSVITEVLDFIFNRRKIEKLMKSVNAIDIAPMLAQHEKNKIAQSELEKIDLEQLEKEVRLMRMKDVRVEKPPVESIYDLLKYTYV